MSVINDDGTLNIDETLNHANQIISGGASGAFIFGSTGQAMLINNDEKKEMIAKASTHKIKKNLYFGIGSNSISETIELIQYAMEYKFNNFLIMPSAYYFVSNEGVYNYFKQIIKTLPKVKIILYNFEKLSKFLFEPAFVKKLVNDFPKNIVGCKDSSYNLYNKLKLQNFMMFPGSEKYLLDGLKNGSHGCISATVNSTFKLSRKVFDDFEKKLPQSANEKLVKVRSVFDKYNLISALHSYFALKDSKYKNIIPPLSLLNEKDTKKLISELENLDFEIKKAA